MSELLIAVMIDVLVGVLVALGTNAIRKALKIA